MRPLNRHSDLGGLDPALQSVITTCLQRWIDAEVLYDPDTETPVYLVEAGDTGEQLTTASSLLAAIDDPDGCPPFEWVTDFGCCFEAALILSDDGSGLSLIVPKTPGISSALLDLCARLATDDVPAD
ncbi:hypothetical protein [Propionivibrio sp.]|uniref:hypothetical protein n=1 Tax=Propionivibrio sp. TaxID=2212460 RepID=UPI0026334CEB|nr:hypothetical protein [Propionivibrio sp.]